MTHSCCSGVDVTRASQQEPNQSHSTFSERGGVENGDQGKEEENHKQMQSTAVKVDQETLQMQSQYQKDFPPPSFCHGRRTPALPQPDNIGINPAFRWQKQVFLFFFYKSIGNVRSDYVTVCLCFQVRVQNSPQTGFPSLVQLKSRMYNQAENDCAQKSKKCFWALMFLAHVFEYT